MNKAERIAEIEMSMSGRAEWFADEIEHAIAACQAILRTPGLDAEQRAIAESQLANYQSMRGNQ